jgi:aminoglycoside phosphotransferase
MDDFIIPQKQRAAVTRGLSETFGVTELEEIFQITKGQTSSLVFRMVVRGTPYLLKIITRSEDPTRHYTIMNAAAETGIAPRVLYASVPDRVLITDYVETAPLSISEARVRLPIALRTLHALPRFSRAHFNTTCTFLLQQGPSSDGFLQKFQAANILPKAEGEEFFRHYTQLAAAYPQEEVDLVSSHNDLFKPDNILFDGQRIWLVDWEAAFPNDRYADLAVVANQVVTNDEEERFYLQEYFGAPPDEYQRARFHLMQQLAHLFYAMAYLHFGAMGEPIDWSQPVPEFSDYQQKVWKGEVGIVQQDEKIIYGRVHWERLLQNIRQPRYNEALRLVAERHASA